MKLLRICGFSNGVECPIAGQYVVSFDFEAERGRGFGEFSADKEKAMRFTDAGAAFTFWQTQSKSVPTRMDGKPNRPLTASTIEIIDEAVA